MPIFTSYAVSLAGCDTVADPGGAKPAPAPSLGRGSGRPADWPSGRSAGKAGRPAVRPEGPREGCRQSRLLGLQLLNKPWRSKLPTEPILIASYIDLYY